MFFGSRERSRAGRRGVVLILILGMLALMALIGVTFATFAGQSLVNTRNFAAGVNWPGSEQLMDYALAQLINDTNNPLSAIRGHSILRDMYGNDSVMGPRFDQFQVSGVSATGSASATGCLITNLGGAALTMTAGVASGSAKWKPFDLTGYFQYTTNIPTAATDPAFYGLDFTRWLVRVPGSGGAAPVVTSGNPTPSGTVTATYEVIEDDYSGTSHIFTLAPLDPSDSTGTHATRVYNNPTVPNIVSTTLNGQTIYAPNQGLILLAQPPGVQFILDGRYMRAFNGPGMSAFNIVGFDSTVTPAYAGNNGAGHPYNNAAYANFRVNGNLLPLAFQGFSPGNLPGIPAAAIGDPSAFGMDEDYDACDLENWFLALQSADGSVMIPSFHRPGILTANDWTNASVLSQAKILRPRAVDNYAPSFPPDPSIPDANGRLTYDIDNDGDGVTDSVWLDLGYPSLRDQRGQTFKPLFAFMVLGLNGRLPLNTAGNLQSRDFQRVSSSSTAAPTGGAPNPLDIQDPKNPFMQAYPFDYYPQNYVDGPTWNHTSHLGYSVNEINPLFALQNAPNLVYGGGTYGATSNFTQFDGFTKGGIGDVTSNGGVGNPLNSRVLGTAPILFSNATTTLTAPVNPGIGIDIVQHRNLLAGTVPQDNLTNPSGVNQELNFYQVGAGTQFFVPDSMYEVGEGTKGVSPANRLGVSPVPGRWGEPAGIPTVLDNNGGTSIMSGGNGLPVVKNTVQPASPPTGWTQVTSTYPAFVNPVRAGKSAVRSAALPLGIGDVGDDDFDAFDIFPFGTTAAAAGASGSNAEGSATYVAATATSPAYVSASTGDAYDNAAALVQPVERIRRFLNPIDAAGVGRVMAWTDSPPLNVYDPGNGFDNFGRVMFFRFFRPAGAPKTVTYTSYVVPGTTPTNAYALTNATTMHDQLNEQQILNQPVMAGPLPNSSNTAPSWDMTTNLLHGYQSALAPIIGIGNGSTNDGNGDARVAIAAAMPYDLLYVAGGTDPFSAPAGYANAIGALNPPYPQISTTNPTAPSTNSPATMTLSVNTGQGPVLTNPPDAINYLTTPGTVTNSYAAVNAAGTPVVASVVNGYPNYPAYRAVGTATVVMPSSSLNKDEADEMNLYTPNSYDMPFGPADLEWLYRLHDIDGAQLTSRLGSLAPVSFLNPQDGLTRRRLFSTDSWETINAAYAPDNAMPIAYDFITSAAGGTVNVFTDPDFLFNSRFRQPGFYTVNAGNNTVFLPGNANLSAINYNQFPANDSAPQYQNPNAITLYPNPLSNPPPSTLITFNATTGAYVPQTNSNSGVFQLAPVLQPSIGSRDRKINLNYPLPVSNDPAEPVRQKWIRETYQYFKSILPPQAIDTPQELAQLSQFVVNIIDFRDPDCSHTRFVNTDLMVIPATATSHSQLLFSTLAVPVSTNNEFVHYPYDPSIYDEQVRAYQPVAGQTLNPTNAVGLQADWSKAMQISGGPPVVTAEFLVQHGMEYNPLALNEVLAYAYQTGGTGATGANPFARLAVEVLNTLTDDGTTNGSGPGSNSTSDFTQSMLDGWDMILTNDGFGYGRPDPITGELPLPGLLNTVNAYPNSATTPTYQAIFAAQTGDPNAQPTQPTNDFTFATTHINGMRQGGPQSTARGAYYQFGWTTNISGSTTAPTPALLNPPITQEKDITNTTVGFPLADAIFPSNFVLPINPLPISGANPSSVTMAAPGTLWCWLYLRRPANPFDTRPYQYREMVTVDAIRFPVTWGDGKGTPGVSPTPDSAAPGTAKIFSMQRLQPYRGGHLVPPLPGTDGKGAGANNPVPGTCWGYSEQTANGAGTVGTTLQIYFGNSNTNTDATQQFLVNGGIPHTFAPSGTPTAPKDGRNTRTDISWDFFPFNDRDFAGVAELLLVPGCPPGLFTKQFVENNDPWDTNDTTGTDSDLQPTTGYASSSPVGVVTVQTSSGRIFPANEAQTYPYLVDKFYYTAASVAPPVINPAPTTPPPYPNLVGGWTGDGWYKMLEFVEVPSSANGAIGPVAAGDNFDWLRQDRKPGLLNLNLIIDEEVFFGLVDDLRLNDSLNAALQANAATATLPLVVTQIDKFGYPVVNRSTAAGPALGSNGFHKISDDLTLNPTGNGLGGLIGRGYTYFDPAGNENHGIKAAFADFLKLRAGGSGFLFAWGSGTTGSGPVQVINAVSGLGVTTLGPYPTWMTGLTSPQPGLLAYDSNGWVTQGTPVARERPFRSLAAPNVDDTILRPASLPPSNLTFPGNAQVTALLPNTMVPYYFYPPYQFFDAAGDPALIVGGTPTAVTPNNPAAPSTTNQQTLFVMDPGVRNPFMTQPSFYNSGTPTTDYGNYAKLPPLIPSRRLFEVPDNGNGSNTPTVDARHISGAAEYLFNPVANDVAGAAPYDYLPSQPIFHEQLFTPTANLIAQTRAITPPGSFTFPNPQAVNQYLGAGVSPTATTNNDNRQHPFFRTQLLQKVMNLTTVRTHQFAVWITIGFFEVLKPGSPSLGQPDVLGGEIGLAGGRNTRYRSFFLLDRTRATGFDPSEPGDFRDVVTYRRRIE